MQRSQALPQLVQDPVHIVDGKSDLGFTYLRVPITHACDEWSSDLTGSIPF